MPIPAFATAAAAHGTLFLSSRAPSLCCLSRPPARLPLPATSARPIFGLRRAAARVLRRRRVALPRLSAGSAAVSHEEEVDPGKVAGTDLRVLRYPHPQLRAANADVGEDELEEVRRVAKEMLLVMYASQGVGLAAPQVGINKRLMVFNAEGDAKAWLQEVVLVNPRIVGSSKGTEVGLEGCLSFPGMAGSVRRSEWVKVEATRLNGKKFKVKYEGWKARVFQHEYDHLEGVLYVDRLEKEDKPKVQTRMTELIEEYTQEVGDDGAPPAL